MLEFFQILACVIIGVLFVAASIYVLEGTFKPNEPVRHARRQRQLEEDQAEIFDLVLYEFDKQR